jgi:hypothetical protein
MLTTRLHLEPRSMWVELCLHFHCLPSWREQDKFSVIFILISHRLCVLSGTDHFVCYQEVITSSDKKQQVISVITQTGSSAPSYFTWDRKQAGLDVGQLQSLHLSACVKSRNRNTQLGLHLVHTDDCVSQFKMFYGHVRIVFVFIGRKTHSL